MKATRVSELFGIQFPVIQAGMIWCSGWELAAAVSNAGGLGVVGAGSMYPDVLDHHLTRLKSATDKPFAVNLPLLYPNIAEHIETILRHRVPIVITSAGNPATHTQHLKQAGIKVVHVVSNVKFAQKAEAAGVDAVVAEGFEAGGHNGREETTTLCLIPLIRQAVGLPLIAAGGIASGAAIAAVFALGAEGAQVGTRFVASAESSAHQAFKQAVLEAQDGSTQLTLKELTPVRLLKNPFFEEVQAAYQRGASAQDLQSLLGRGRAKKGMFEGNLVDGELEIGQVAATIKTIEPAADILRGLILEFDAAVKVLNGLV
jgi:enoyl-[acyl-carrier protein] reductase II